MRAVIQRVKYAHVIIDRKEKRTSGPGLMILLGIGHSDNQDDVKWLANKIFEKRTYLSLNWKLAHSRVRWDFLFMPN